jgi:hypothetical protein
MFVTSIVVWNSPKIVRIEWRWETKFTLLIITLIAMVKKLLLFVAIWVTFLENIIAPGKTSILFVLFLKHALNFHS